MIDMNAPLLNFKGDTLVDTGEDGSSATRALLLRDVVQRALITPIKTDEDLTALEKFGLESLARRAEDDSPEFSVEDLSKIKARIAAVYTQLIIGPAWRLLDPSLGGADHGAA